MPLTRRTVGRNVEVIVLGRPAGILYKFIDKGMRGAEADGALHIRVYGYRSEIPHTPGYIALDESISEAEHCKPRLVLVVPFSRRVTDLLKGSLSLLGRALNVLLGELAVLVKHLAEAKIKGLSRLCLEGEADISRDILTEVEDGSAARGGDEDRICKDLLFPNGNVV